MDAVHIAAAATTAIGSIPKLSLPWLDCTGPGFVSAWDRLHERLLEVTAMGRMRLAAVHVDEMPPVPWEELKDTLPPFDMIHERTHLHHKVLAGDLHPDDLEGHCHLGFVLLKYMQGRAYLTMDTARGHKELSMAWNLLAYPLGVVVNFDLLESSRWGTFLTFADLLQAAAMAKKTYASGTEPWAAMKNLVADGGSVLTLWSQPKQHFKIERDSPTEVLTRNLTVAALSTHVAVAEPVASLRKCFEWYGVHVSVRFLGAMHPKVSTPCKLLPMDSKCSNGVRGWGTDILRFLHPLGDMTDGRFREPGFMPELFERVELIHRRHIAAPKTDFIVCAHPFLLCAILRALTSLFMLVYLTPTPLTLVPDADRLWVLTQLATMAEHRSTAVFAASPIYALHALYQVGKQIQVVRPSAFYIADNHQWKCDSDHKGLVYLWFFSGISKEFVVTMQGFLNEARAAELPIVQEVRITFKDLLAKQGLLSTPYVPWDFLAKVRCVVLLPWDLQLTVFAELYALGVPLVLPNAEYVASYCLRTLAKDGINFWSVQPRFAGRLPSGYAKTKAFAAEPWVQISELDDPAGILTAEAQLVYWYRALAN
eukprot:gnl/TRDRNA2_/TRDRNA2_127225_c0_seq3.p1 gnl/TRDRNA2_/TRDRNA2_127225_c0~~gnl/TRDRNA2_/TRDRNA2_127225_c0_seq3.p1  ORF type:complete len:595 (-),score=101.59 gnl/TRDRNA2_/TRDRNA2_127225_c0_seq3:37-1821(-)